MVKGCQAYIETDGQTYIHTDFFSRQCGARFARPIKCIVDKLAVQYMYIDFCRHNTVSSQYTVPQLWHLLHD